MPNYPPGVSGGSAVVLNKTQIGFLRQLRKLVPRATPIYVTSGTRTPEAQARALAVKRKGDPSGKGILKLYGYSNAIKAILAVPNSISAMARVIRAQIGAGTYLSRHMRGDAVDIRNRNLNQAQQAQIVAAAKRLGARAIVERNPPHIHIGRISGGEALAHRSLRRAGRGAAALYKKRQIIYTVSAVSAALLIISLLAVRHSRKRRSRSASSRTAR